MMAPRVNKDGQRTGFTPPDRRGLDRPSRDGIGLLLRRIKVNDLVAWVALISAVLFGLGYRRYDPEGVDAALTARLARAEARVDTITTKAQRDSMYTMVEIRELRRMVSGLDSSDRCRRGFRGFCR